MDDTAGSRSLHEIVRQFARAYLGVAAKRVVEVAGGVVARSFRVDRNVLVRYDSTRTFDEVQLDRVCWHEAQRAGVSTVGELFVIKDCGGYVLSGRPFISGRTLSQSASTFVMQRAGFELRRLHSVQGPTTDRKFVYSFAYDPSDLFWHYIERFACAHPVKSVARMATTVVAELRRITLADYVDSTPRGFVHGDYKPANLISQYNNLYVIDWDKACTGPQMLDLALACFHLSRFPPKSFASFLDGYFADKKNSMFDWHAFKLGVRAMSRAFYLRDAAKAGEHRWNHALDPKREMYFREYCTPLTAYYLTYEERFLRRLRLG